MKTVDSESYKEILESVVIQLKAKGVSRINANIKGYDDPPSVHWDETDKGIVPDLIANLGKKTLVFEFTNLKRTPDKDLIDRWKLLSAHARRNSGELYVIVPGESEDMARDTLDTNGVKARILTISGL